jgi:hypothetical protein
VRCRISLLKTLLSHTNARSEFSSMDPFPGSQGSGIAEATFLFVFGDYSRGFKRAIGPSRIVLSLSERRGVQGFFVKCTYSRLDPLPTAKPVIWPWTSRLNVRLDVGSVPLKRSPPSKRSDTG